MKVPSGLQYAGLFTQLLFSFNNTFGDYMNGQVRVNIRPGITVQIVLKKDQRTGTLTKGIVKDILTSSPTHTRGIKVRLQSGEIGRVQEILAS